MHRFCSFLFFWILGVSAVRSESWSNWERYNDDNLLISSLEKIDSRIVLLGDSITDNWIRVHPCFFSNNQLVNRGVSGQTTSQMLVRFQADVVKLDADVVVILGGTNDLAENQGPSSPAQILDNIVSMVDIARRNGVFPIVCSVLPAVDFYWRKGLNPAPKILQLNQLLKSYAEKENLVYLDYYSVLVNSENGMDVEIAADGIHPNEQGYTLMESLLQPILCSFLQEMEIEQ